jgi:small-conductance mechanosensitive channel
MARPKRDRPKCDSTNCDRPTKFQFGQGFREPYRRSHRSLFSRLVSSVLGAIVVCAFVVLAVPAWGLLPDVLSLDEPSQPVSIETQAEPFELPTVDGFLTPVGRYINSAPVRLDGRTLFRVAPTDTISAQIRAAEIQQRLTDIAERVSNPSTLQVYWQPDRQNNLPVIYIDNGIDNRLFLLTVTELDARLAGASDPTIGADELRRTIQTGFQNYRQERQPGFLWQQAQIAGLLLLGVLVFSWALARVQSWLSNRKARITEQIAALPPSDPSDPPSAQVVSALRQKVSKRQKLGIVEFQRWLCRIGQVLLWVGGFFAILGLFPYSRWLQPLIVSGFEIPFKVAMVVLIIYGLIRLSNVLIDRTALILQERTAFVSSQSQRLALRFSTFSQVIKSIVAVIIIGIGVLTILAVLGFDLGPLLAGAGIIGLAVSLASQNLLRDIINGFLILMEDQYGVGDVIVVGDVAGFVETMNLRITQLRNEEGRLITIPNSQIAIVQNLSKEWSRVDIMIPISHTADINQALELVEQVADDMRDDPTWKNLILEPPLLLGVDNLDHVGATVRIWIKTLPLKQWDVAREYRRRLKIAFDRTGINIGVPQQSLQIQSALPVFNLSKDEQSREPLNGDEQSKKPQNKES